VENKTKNSDEPIKFYGPPISYEELMKLGYTLNAYHLVKNQQTDIGKNQSYRLSI